MSEICKHIVTFESVIIVCKDCKRTWNFEEQMEIVKKQGAIQELERLKGFMCKKKKDNTFPNRINIWEYVVEGRLKEPEKVGKK